MCLDDVIPNAKGCDLTADCVDRTADHKVKGRFDEEITGKLLIVSGHRIC